MSDVPAMLRRVTVGLAAAGAVVVTLAGPAAAHVESKATAVTPAGVSTVRFSFDHGCGPSPTVSLRIKLPADAADVSPGTAPTGWTAAVHDGVLEWQGPAVANGTSVSFNTTVRLVGTKGDTVYFPTVQTCVQGSNDWIELPVAGESEPEHVAPSVTLMATVAAPATTTTTTTVPAEAPPAAEGVTATIGVTTASTVASGDGGDGGGGGMAIVPLAIGGVAVVVIGGGIAVARGRRSDARSDASS